MFVSRSCCLRLHLPIASYADGGGLYTLGLGLIHANNDQDITDYLLDQVLNLRPAPVSLDCNYYLLSKVLYLQDVFSRDVPRVNFLQNLGAFQKLCWFETTIQQVQEL